MKTSNAEKSRNAVTWLDDVPASIEEFHKSKDTFTKECRWYLIGKYCVREKQKRKKGVILRELYTQLGQGFGCSEPTIRRFVSYYKLIECLRLTMPELVIDMISGEIKLSVENARSLLNRPQEDIPKIVARVKSGEESICAIFPERAAKSLKQTHDSRRITQPAATVKDTPKYDPDAQVVGLTYTIPSWVNAIDRVFMSDNLCEVSTSARKKLIKELSALKSTADVMIKLLTQQARRKE